MEIEKDLLAIFNEVLASKGRELNTLNDDMDLRDQIGFDSFDLAELTVRVEEKYGVDIFETGLVLKVKEVKAKIQQHLDNE